MKGKLYLIPCSIGGEKVSEEVNQRVVHTLSSLRHFIVENERSARRFIRALIPDFPIDDSQFKLIDKHNLPSEYSSFLKPCKEGNSVGLISEAGCPAIADPGEEIVAAAHHLKITVVPLVGPSSILLTVMGSGLNGENFAFNGYLPIDKVARARKLKQLEHKVIHEKQTQLFMDTPFRNNQLLHDVLTTCQDTLKLCIATDLTLPSEHIGTVTLAEWKQIKPDLHKRLVMFALGS